MADALGRAMGELIEGVGALGGGPVGGVGERTGGGTVGPTALAGALGIDKVLASRLLKALRERDAASSLHAMPGPEPLRRVARACVARGVHEVVGLRASEAIARYEALIRGRAGDRSRLDAVLSAWAPSARREFELRRKQSLFRAMSEVRGVRAAFSHATVIVGRGQNEEAFDLVWVNGYRSLCRVRPGAVVKFASRRVVPWSHGRSVRALSGGLVTDPGQVVFRPFSSVPPPVVRVEQVEDTVQYVLGDGPVGEGKNLVYGEVCIAEVPRRVPTGSGRRGFFFAEVAVPCEVLQFDVLIQDGLYWDEGPELSIYDTSFEGVANVNDRRRDLDRLDLLESVESLGFPAKVRSGDMSEYGRLVEVAIGARWDYERTWFRGYRCRIDYPIYGTQVVMSFKAEEEEDW